MTIKAQDVKELREKTGLGMMECKKALEEANGNLEEAIKNLRKSSALKAEKKASRTAVEGIITSKISDKEITFVEVNCETDFVAKNEDFVAFASDVASQLLNDPNTDLESQRTEQVAKIGENIRISRSASLSVSTNGIVESYVHTGGKVAVLLSISTGKPESASSNNLKELAKDLCMHIAATSPVCVSRDDVPQDLVQKETEIAKAQAEGKPPQAIEKIVAGKLDKYFSNSCFLEQSFVKDPDQNIKDLLSSLSGELSDEIKVDSFLRFQVGEEV
jgi:elongation factor Ts